MKLNLKPIDIVKDFLVIASAVGVLGGVAYSAGWLVNRADAGEMIKQSVYEEALEREVADLKFQVELTNSKMQLLAAKPDRNAYDELVLRGYVEELGRLKERIIDLEAPEEE